MKRKNKDDNPFTLYWFSLSIDLYDEIQPAEIWLNSQYFTKYLHALLNNRVELFVAKP